MLSEQVRAIGGVWGESEPGFRQSLGKFPGLQLMRFQLQSSASNKVTTLSMTEALPPAA